jgi:succinylarginine dihydrolase
MTKLDAKREVKPTAYEVNFDGLPGPTHNYAGLSSGNLASTSNESAVSHPKEAALQGLKKMKFLADAGLRQGVIPPQERPDLSTLKKLGFRGNDREILSEVIKIAPKLLNNVSSASSMWTANAATVSPSADSQDGKVHFTPANLSNKFHRAIEVETTGKILKAIFKNEQLFAHHAPLPTGLYFGDEGAANHTRLCHEYGERGIQLFVYGNYTFESGRPHPKKFPARQSFEASSAVARNHQLDMSCVVLAQQNPAAIDAGIFHNDVISVGNKNTFFYHEEAFLDRDRVLAELSEKFFNLTQQPLRLVAVTTAQVGMPDVVKSYLFNSQLVNLSVDRPDEMTLVVPSECSEIESVSEFLKQQTSRPDSPIQKVQTFNLKESMRNGGGPACLRLRVVLNEKEIAGTNPDVFMNANLYSRLETWIHKHYRDRLAMNDLADPNLVNEVRASLDELTQILGLGSIYPFQQNK